MQTFGMQIVVNNQTNIAWIEYTSLDWFFKDDIKEVVGGWGSRCKPAQD